MLANKQKYGHDYRSGYLENIEIDNTFSERILQEIEHPTFGEYFSKPVDIFETVIISDIHLGSKVSRTDALLDFLERVRFKRLIINGDVFDSINMRRLNRYHWKVLSRLRRLTDQENHQEVIWIRGNHDGFSDLLTQLLGVKVFNEYQFNWNDKTVIVLHGDIFDTFTSNYSWLSDVADYFYRLSIYLDPVKMRFGRWLKRNSKTFIRNTIMVRDRALNYARHKNADIIICGHTHYAEETEQNGRSYFNSGSWTDSPAHFIGITEDEIRVVPYL